MNFDAFDAVALNPAEVDLRGKLEALNSYFSSAIKPENGVFGPSVVDKGGGWTELTSRNQEGRICRDYLRDGRIYKQRISLGNHEWASIDFDDNGTGYLKTLQRLGKDGLKITDTQLRPNTTVVKSNFTAVIDNLGRPILNTIEDFKLRESGTPRQSLNPKLRTQAYRPNDQRGHIIPDLFGGPATLENVAAQLDEVNQKNIREVERLAESLKREGHKVDYSVKTNYVASEKRPSSFEPRIVVDGVEYDLPDHLKKIYNDSINDSELASTVKKAATNLGERYGLIHEEGVRSAKVAAALSCAVSTCENVSSFIDGEITPEEMVTGIVGDTVAAGGIAYGTTFISGAVSQAMAKSSSALIRSVGGSTVPASVVTFAVQSYHDLSDFAQGNIEADELAYNLGENAAEVAGGAQGAVIGAQVGAIAGPAGIAVGTIVGGTIGCALASEAYATAIEVGSEGAYALAEQARKFATDTIEVAANAIPDQIDTVHDAFNTYLSVNTLTVGPATFVNPLDPVSFTPVQDYNPMMPSSIPSAFDVPPYSAIHPQSAVPPIPGTIIDRPATIAETVIAIHNAQNLPSGFGQSV